MVELKTLGTSTTREFTDNLNNNFNDLNFEAERIEKKLSEDFVLEQGTMRKTNANGGNIIWTYRVWNSGTVECWAKTPTMNLYYDGDWYSNCVYTTVDIPFMGDFFEFTYDEGRLGFPTNLVINTTISAGSGIHTTSIYSVNSTTIGIYVAEFSNIYENKVIGVSINVKGQCNSTKLAEIKNKSGQMQNS